MVRTIDFNKLRDNAKKVEKPAKQVDQRFFRLDRNDDGNAFAVIRFLPQVEGEDTYLAMKYSHFFTENNKTYSEICPTVIGEPCPVCECNRDNWKSYGPVEKARKRKVRYVTNILVVKDKEHPEREGQNYLYEFGEKIFKKISNVIYDNDDEGTKGYDVFDFMKGKNFKLKIKTVSDFPNYDDSEFIPDAVPVFEGNEKKINALDKKIFPLAEFIPTKESIKSYDELKVIFQSKIDPTSSAKSASTSVASTPTQSARKEEKLDEEPVAPAKTKAVVEQDFFLGDD